ncbi:MFS transporter [Kyrpidia spormannii]|uniref:Major facilitator superfamily MFS_1 n=1 Tax=Kyrpidia spormannii TaxID=2055160 RepID=A0ACA8ZAJ1_9BACL|nr:aromatic acid/H+ symport family MFS transporter [Kyrpidia spormannii]CAB3393557.1 Major facilitator superfamily MFS_1 [Kyrpidia spormannii]
MEKSEVLLAPGTGGYALVDVPRSLTTRVVLICWLAIFFEGYDLAVYGAVLPAILTDSSFPLTAVQAGAIGSYAVFGMCLGAIFLGSSADYLGRKKMLIASMLFYAVGMVWSALAPNTAMLGASRFVAGLGLGGVLPTTSALTVEYSHPARRSLTAALMYTGYPLGGAAAACLALWLLPVIGWRGLFWLGGLAFLLIPFAVGWMPESLRFLLDNERKEAARALILKYRLQVDRELAPLKPEPRSELSKRSLSVIFSSGRWAAALVLFWLAYFMDLLMTYGLNTWLPQMMHQAGYSLGSSLAFMLILNVSAAAGGLIEGLAADRLGSKWVSVASFALAAVAIILMVVKWPVAIVYVLAALAGIGVIGTAILVNAYITKYFPVNARGTAFGLALGFGRAGAIGGPLIGGLILAWHLPVTWNFVAFSIAGLIGMFVMALMPRSEVQV